jgi:hypothetical protein
LSGQAIAGSSILSFAAAICAYYPQFLSRKPRRWFDQIM